MRSRDVTRFLISFIILFGLTTLLFAQTGDLFFSEYIEGSSNNKALEIFNPTDQVVSLDDYRIAQSVNGGGWQYYHYFPEGSILNPNDVWVIVADEVDTNLFDPILANEVLSYPSVVHFNGDDARALEKRTISGTDTTWTIIDIIGDPDNDPGSGWDVSGVSAATKDHTLVRKFQVTSGTTDWNAAAGTNNQDGEWFVYDEDTFIHLGTHPYPAIEQAAEGFLNLPWSINESAAPGSLVVLDSTANAWGSYIVQYRDVSYTGLAYIDSIYYPDYTISADVYLVGPPSADAPLYTGIAIKTSSTDFQYYRFVYRNSSSSNNGQLKLQGYDGASWHISQAWDPGVDFDTLETGWHKMEVRVIGNDFFAFIDGMMLPGCPYNDDDPFMVEGYPGVYTYNSSGGSVTFDNYVVGPGVYPPMADAGPDMLADVGALVVLQGQLLNALPGNEVTWTQVAGPSVALSDVHDLNASFTADTAGTYVFELKVTAGPYWGHADQVVITVGAEEHDLFVDFEDDSDIPNWSHWDEANAWTTEEWDSTGGVDGSGALKLGDGGYSFLDKRPINAIPGTPFKLDIDLKVTGWDDPENYPLYLQVQGIGDFEPQVVINNAADFTHFELAGISTDTAGYIKIYGNNAYISSNVWVDNVNWDDNAEAYDLSGVVTMSDGGDPSDVAVFLKGYEGFWETTPDAAGNYQLSTIPHGTYTIVAKKTGYVDVVIPDFTIMSDTTLDITMMPGDLNLTFEDDSDVPNWGIFTLDNKYTTVAHDPTGGVGGSGALLLRDGGWGFAIEREVFATPGTYFSLSVDLKIKDIPEGLFLAVSGISETTPMITVTGDGTNFTTFTLTGYATHDHGYIQLYNYDTGSGPDSVWVDNLIWEDDATIETYTLSGTVTLSDGATPSDVFVTLAGWEDYFSAVTNDAGEYSIPGIPGGVYEINASKFGYKDFNQPAYAIYGDSTLDFVLIRNQVPVAVAGDDIDNAQVGVGYILDASGSYDPDGDPLTYTWYCDDTTVVIQPMHSGNAGIRPHATGTYKFYLVVSDGTDESDPDSMTVTVTQEAAPPERPFAYRGNFLPGYEGKQGVQGMVVDPDGKVWLGYYYSHDIDVWLEDGTRAPWSPITQGVAGGDTLDLGRCYGMAIDPQGNVYYCDTDNDMIFKFDYQTGDPLGGFAVGPGSPTCGIDQDGYIYVGKVLNNTIDIYSPSFDLVLSDTMEYGAVGRELEVFPDGSKIIIGGFSGNVYLLEGSRDTGYDQVDNLIGPFSPVGDMADIGIDADGFVYITESVYSGTDQTDYLDIFSPDLQRMERYVLEDMDRPRGIGFAPGGDFIYAGDFGGATGGNIKRFALPDVQLITPLTVIAEDDENGKPTLIDSTVLVRGIVSVADQFGTSGPAFIQTWNNVAGVGVWDPDFVSTISIGDRVLVNAMVSFFNGLTELTNIEIEDIVVEDTAQLAIADTVQLGDITYAPEEWEGRLVFVSNVYLVDPENWPAEGSDANLQVTDGTDTLTLRVDKDTDIDGANPPQESFNLTAVVTQFDNSEPYFDGYQLMPRFMDDFHGAVTPVGISNETELPRVFALHQNFPNPFNPTTVIKYDLPKDTHVKLVIYDLMGHRIRTLVNEKQRAGFKQIVWDGKDDRGRLVSSGFYLYRIVTPEFVKTRKMTIVK